MAEKIRELDTSAEILFFMREDGKENESVTKQGFQVWTFPTVGFQRHLKNIADFSFTTIISVAKCIKKIKEFKPDKILGTGGYVSFAPALSGMLLKIPTYIHESNITPGMVTKILSKFGCNILLNTDETKKYLSANAKTTAVGNPLLSSFDISRKDARKKLGIADADISIVSFGGSGGSETLNNTIISVMNNYSRKNVKIKHLHATGHKYFERVKESSPHLVMGVNGCSVVPYIDDMPIRLRAADIVISRCGAMTLTEIAKCATAAILIPSPNVTDNHQYKNGAFLAEKNAAILVEESDLTEELLIEKIALLVGSKEARKAFGERISQTVKHDAETIISKMLIQ